MKVSASNLLSAGVGSALLSGWLSWRRWRLRRRAGAHHQRNSKAQREEKQLLIDA
jgi:hypothetical protein